jgi:hypothetical protein
VTDPTTVEINITEQVIELTGVPAEILVESTVPIVVEINQQPVSVSISMGGPAGPTGATGPGVAAGGSAGQYLRKTTSSNYATYWSGLRVETFAGSLPVYGAAGYFAYDTAGQTFHLTDNNGNWHQLWPAVDANNLPNDPYLGQIAVDPNGFKTVYCWNGSIWVPLD